MLHIRLRHFIPEAAIIGEVTGIGIPSFLQLSGQSAALIIVNQFLRKYGGDLAISSYGIANRIIVFFSSRFRESPRGCSLSSDITRGRVNRTVSEKRCILRL